MDTHALIELRAWYRAEFDRRTAALQSGSGHARWLDPRTRISWAEVCDKAHEFGINASPDFIRAMW